MKTLPLYLLIVGVWVLTVFIPGRYLILALGLSEFVYKFTPQPDVLPQKSRLDLFCFSNIVEQILCTLTLRCHAMICLCLSVSPLNFADINLFIYLLNLMVCDQFQDL